MLHVLRAGRRAMIALLATPALVLGFSVFLGSCASFQFDDGEQYGSTRSASPPSSWHPVSGAYTAATAQATARAQAAPPQATEDPSVVTLRAKLVQGAHAVLGRKELFIRGRRFTMDCTGTVLAIYWYAGIDLSQDFSRLRGNGVSRIYQTLQRRNLLYTTVHPLSGDIIFWDDTYDEDGYEGQPNPLSHMGMVVSVDPEGTIAYVHYHIRRGITIDYMNLESPDVQNRMENGSLKVINSPLRLAVPGRPHAARWLAGQLYRVLGLGYLLE